MNAVTAKKNRLTGLFLLGLGSLYLIGIAAVCATPSHAVHRVLAGYALPIDCMLVLPTLFYLAVVRRNNLSPLLVLPVMWAGGALAAFFARGFDRTVIIGLGACALAVEIAIAIHEIVRFAVLFRTARSASDDVRDWFFAPLEQMTRSTRAATLAANELVMLYYALLAWGRAARKAPGESFSYHKNSGYSAFMAGMMLVVPVEIVVVHLLVSHFNATAAWLLTALSLYAVLWLIADCRASVLRPIIIGEKVLEIRSGLRFSADIPLEAIASLDHTPPHDEKKRLVDLGMMGCERIWLVFAAPLEVATAIGGFKEVDAIGISVDERARFECALQATLASIEESAA
ncbi:hypothetical protein [Raoultibacter phocaeensis]|uniref:hypothetical protein n=1 Tax=Raoultibacter phocaeensis TaxID=2479841 RepID=UPI00111BC9C0|nr:hypothetical protein [Raoultibacter phocaeensis]